MFRSEPLAVVVASAEAVVSVPAAALVCSVAAGAELLPHPTRPIVRTEAIAIANVAFIFFITFPP